MATSITNPQCSVCNEENETYECKGCSEIFCFEHLTEHRKLLNEQFNQIEDNYNSFREIVNEQKTEPNKRLLIKEIDKWEEDSIEKIKQTAEHCRQRLVKLTNKYIIEIENNLNKLTDELKQIRTRNKFNEKHLNHLPEKLQKMQEELNKPSNVSIEQQSTSFINKIFLVLPLNPETNWKQVGLTIAGGNSQGCELNQLSTPLNIFIDDDQTTYIADCGNHRIVEWKYNAANGRIVAGGNGQGNQSNQLNYPSQVIINKENDSLIISDSGNKRVVQWSRQQNTEGQVIIHNIQCYGLAMNKNGYLYVADSEKDEVRRWKRGETDGTIVAGGNGKGDQINQLNYPTYIFVDKDDSLYVSDSNNHRVMKWEKDGKEGIVVAGGNGEGNSLAQSSHPRELTVDQFGQIYVAERNNNRVMRWCKGAREGTIVVGGNGQGAQPNQFNGSRGVLFDRQGSLYVVDCDNHRIQKFEIASD